MKKIARLILATLVLSLCVMAPVAVMAEDEVTVPQGPTGPGFYTEGADTYYYIINEKSELEMAKGWQTIDDNKYYFQSVSGKMFKGLHRISGEKYLFDDTGKMLTRWQTIGDDKYYFQSTTGKMFKGLHKISGEKYLFDDTGKMLTRWQTIDGYEYYFQSTTGKMFKGKHKIQGYYYYFGRTTGKNITGWVTIDGGKCYFSKKTKKMFTGKHKIGDYSYYFSKTTGKRLKGWRTIDGAKYYFGGDYRRMYTGLHKIGKNVYTFASNGKLKRTVYGSKKAICLTFDDGPSVNTDSILSTLKKYDARATFFVVGDRTGTYKKQIQAEVKAGCQIGNHTQNHKMLASCTASGIKSQIKKCNTSVKKNASVTPKVCRTPGGEQNSKIKSNVGMPIILWSVDTLDWKTQNATSTYNAVMKGAKDGAVVLMHDLYKPTADAVKKIVPALDKKGYQIVTIDEMRLLKGKKLKNGVVYYSF